METLNQTDQQYKDWLIELKSKIRNWLVILPSSYSKLKNSYL